MIRRSIVAAVLAGVVVVAFAAPAWAPRTWFLPSIQGVACTTHDSQTGSFSGEITVTRFAKGEAGLEALAQLDGVCVMTSGAELEIDSDLLQIPLSVVATSCERLELLLGPTVVESESGLVSIDQFKVVIDNPEGSKSLAKALCLTSRLVRLRADLQAQVVALNQVLAAS